MANGIDSFEALKARNLNQNMTTRNIIESYVFLDIAEVTAFKDGYVTCQVGNMTYTNVEVLVIGVNGFGLKLVPAIKDRVLLLSPRTAMGSVKKFNPSYTMPNYDASGFKCVPLTDDSTAQLFTVDKDSIKLTPTATSAVKTTISISSSGINITDAKGNKITTDSDGITFNGHLVVK